MTEQEKAAKLEAQRMEMEQRLAEGARMRRAEFDEHPIQGQPCAYTVEEFYLPMPDGVKLYMKAYKPTGMEKFPVLIQRSCYPFQQVIYDVYGEELAKRGYGYVLQICRGTGKSEGVWEPNVNERPDGLATLEWLNAQPWVESIGYFGASYLALTGWAIADEMPEKVKGMMLTVYGTDRFTSAYEKGLFRHDVLTGWAMSNAGHPVAADYLESCRFRPHAKVDEALWGGRLDWYQDWIHSTRRSDAYWQQGWWKLLEGVPGRTKVPVFIVDSWYDHHFGSAVNTWLSLSEETKKHSWLDIGCWNHMFMNCMEFGPHDNLNMSEVERLLEWFDPILKQGKTPEMRVCAYTMREDAWKELAAWPAPVTAVKNLYLGTGKTLEDAPAAPGSVSFDYDPENPCPSHGAESVLTTITEAGTLAQPGPDYRPDVVSFISKPLTEALPICGKIKVHLNVATDVDDTAFAIKLMEVFPDGSAYNIRTGITTILADNDSYTPGTGTNVCVDTWDMAWTVQPGSRLRLDVTSSDFPQYVAHSNYAGIWADAGKTRVAHQTVFTGCEGSYVELPLSR